MVRTGPHREEWVDVGLDEDGTAAFLDRSSIVLDIQTAFFCARVKHVPPQESRTYEELKRALKSSKKTRTAPHHVKQLLEIDPIRGLSRTMNLIVCDKEGSVLDTIGFRFPEWTTIKEGSIIDIVRGQIASGFAETTVPAGPDESPLTFIASEARPKADGIDVTKRYRPQPQGVTKLKLAGIDS